MCSIDSMHLLTVKAGCAAVVIRGFDLGRHLYAQSRNYSASILAEILYGLVVAAMCMNLASKEDGTCDIRDMSFNRYVCRGNTKPSRSSNKDDVDMRESTLFDWVSRPDKRTTFIENLFNYHWMIAKTSQDGREVR
jgi:hypothetical protein